MSTFSLILPSRNPTSTPPAATNETMTSTPSDLVGLRRRLDDIDDKLHDLLVERAGIITKVAASKKDSNLPALQPAREAEIIRRLVERHHGTFPVATLVRMWREMLAATVGLQSHFGVAVFAPPEHQGFWDLARDHYGSITPMLACPSPGRVIRAVTDGLASVGVLPMPREGEPDPWWRHLLAADEDAPRVVARLPFGSHGNARNGGADALAVGRGAQQATGLDRTLLVTEGAADTIRGRISEVLSSLGFHCTFCMFDERAGRVANLIEIDGFVPRSDPRLDRVRAKLGGALYRLLPFGGYAVPLPRTVLATKG
jgi:chorismate mutase / prephenate dehydratase